MARPASPAKLTEACAFLGVEEIADALGLSPQVRHQQEQPSKVDGAVTNFQCTYDVGRDLALLTITAVPNDVTPKALTDQKRKDCAGGITPMPAVGSGGWFCQTPDGFEEIVTGKTGHGQVRMLDLIIFEKGGRPDAYSALAKLVVDRL